MDTHSDDAPPSDLPDDGTYETLVIDAEPAGDGAARLDLTVVTGGLKGRVVSVRVTGLGDDPLELLGVPATVTVVDGAPSVVFET